MRIHRNAKTTPAARAALVHRVLHEDWTYAETATAFAVSERTVAKWVHRFRVGGVAARAGPTPDAGTGSHADPAAARGPGFARVGHCPHSGPAALDGERLAATLGISRSPTRPPVPVRRYEWPRPGDLLHVDIKPLARIRAVGHRIHGDRRRPHASLNYHAPWSRLPSAA